MKYLFTITLMVCIINCKSQNKTEYDTSKIIEINPFGSNTIPRHLRHGDYVKVKITHVNPFRTMLKNTVTSQSISFDAPPSISGSPVPSKGETNKTSTTTVESNNKEIKKLESDITKLQKQENAIILDNTGGTLEIFGKKNNRKLNVDNSKKIKMKRSLNNEILRKQKRLKELNRKNTPVISINTPDTKSEDELKNDFITAYKCFTDNLNLLTSYTEIYSYIDSKLQDKYIPEPDLLKRNLENFMKSLNENNTDFNLIRTKANAVFNSISDCYNKATKDYEELAREMKNETNTFSGELKGKDGDILKVDSAFSSFSRKKYFEKEYKFMNTAMDNIKSKRNSIDSTINQGIDLYYQVSNSDFSIYDPSAYLLDEDYVTITPTLKDSKGQTIEELKPIRVRISSGWKVDFSSGYLLSFKGDDNFTNRYDNNGIIGVQKNHSDNLKHALGALINAYPRSGKDWNVGYSIGFSIPTDGSTIGFYTGLSGLFLEKNRLVITAGIAFNKIKLLNRANLEEDKPASAATGSLSYKFLNTTYRDIKYDEVYRPAFFFGFTYNLFNLKK